ncbi:MAG: peptidase lon domain protein [Frankiales bacterium]|nr:peptidase lon domain protein [Frankiales bacterium]
MARSGVERLPLFPLGLVLFPGLVLPLHVFEERYRVLVRELLDKPEQDRRFGVVAIREGREVGEDGVRALHAVGCVARLQEADEHPDGRFDVLTVGAERFRLRGLDTTRPYLTGEVELLPDDAGDPSEGTVLRDAVGSAFAAYLEALRKAGAEELGDVQVPRDPRTASYLVAATVLLDLEERQSLLAVPDAVDRLRRELRLLRREAGLLQALSSVPAPELTRGPLSLN